MRKVVLSQFEKEKLTYLQKYSDNSVERNRSLNSQNKEITAPSRQGMYIIEFLYNNGTRKAMPIVVF